MAAKTWESDFRYPAMQASVRKFRDDFPDDLFATEESFCVPVGDRPVRGWTPGKTMLVALVLGFALLGGGVAILSFVDEEADDISATLLTLLAVTSSLSGIAMFFLPLLLDRYLVAWCIGWRGKELLDQPDGDVFAAEVSDTDRTRMKIQIDGDDYVLVRMDETQGRLWIEGVSARYQVQRRDVLAIEPFQFMNYLGAELEYRIDDETSLRIAIARVSMLWEVTNQLPFLAFLRKRIPNRPLRYLQTWWTGVEEAELVVDGAS
ncbi:hypothetical protein FYK55_01230 [Roseiconus nitratireducens]|uniref:Uncharacterized protein n=1 Tax=Roseiconus nitratireducens TaxID=2605748 RepID=A0A5M6DLR3_9BACT|nr:hypothetical protein [Roseiconus nitratireducens]KAA5547070.1 hypothetical protein FYK55_01230 [Roseiconus nitratireducens]